MQQDSCRRANSNLPLNRFLLMHSRLIPLIFFLSSISLHAQIRLPALISDNMILQQHSTVALWGWAGVGEKITIAPGWSTKTTQVKADKNGKWMARIATLGHGGPYSIR